MWFFTSCQANVSLIIRIVVCKQHRHIKMNQITFRIDVIRPDLILIYSNSMRYVGHFFLGFHLKCYIWKLQNVLHLFFSGKRFISAHIQCMCESTLRSQYYYCCLFVFLFLFLIEYITRWIPLFLNWTIAFSWRFALIPLHL